MFYEIIEAKYDSSKNPDEVRTTVGRYQLFERATADARELYKENKPEDYKTIVSEDFYANFLQIAEKLDENGRIQQYMVEVQEVQFDG